MIAKPTGQVSATWSGGGRLVITVPQRRLPEVRGAEHFARVFPGCEAAGIVLRAQSESARRVAPLYYFVLPVPNGLMLVAAWEGASFAAPGR